MHSSLAVTTATNYYSNVRQRLEVRIGSQLTFCGFFVCLNEKFEIEVEGKNQNFRRRITFKWDRARN